MVVCPLCKAVDSAEVLLYTGVMTGRKQLLNLTLCVLLVVILAGCNPFASSQQAAGPPTPVVDQLPATAAGDYQQAMAFGGLTRTYYLHLPPAINVSVGQPLPLVIMLHGAGGTGASFAAYTGMSQEADHEGFIVVYPDGSDPQQGHFTFNAHWCCFYAQDHKIDDVGYISALIDLLHQRYNVNLKMVYASGFSNGAMMVYWLADQLAGKIAAIAPVSGAMAGDEPAPAGTVSAIVFHGDADNNVLYNGVNKSDYHYLSVAGSVGFWAKADGCKPSAQHQENAASSHDDYTGCTQGSAVTLYTIKGGAHAWPGDEVAAALAGNTAKANTAALIWNFFKAHKKG